MKIIDMEGLLVRLVDNLVSTSASEVSEGDEVLGPKRTSQVAPHMSALGGKADLTFCTAHIRF